MRIAFLTTGDPRRRDFWSGTPYSMLHSLRRRCGEVVPLGPLRSVTREVVRACVGARNRLTRGRFDHTHSRVVARAYARAAGRRLSEGRYDIIVAPAASEAVAYLETDLPIVYLSDATFRLMVDYYPAFSSLTRASLSQGEEIERRAIERSCAVVHPTRWSARSVVEDYGADPSRVHVIPYGPNLDAIPDAAVARRHSTDVCRLLFIGVDWVRKGGDIALGTLRALRERGIPAELVIVGCAPPDDPDVPGVRLMGRLDKSSTRDVRVLDELFASSTFLLLPTRAECSGIVFAEASAYGLPSIANRTGGVPDVVLDGRNGFLLDPDAGPREYASLIGSVCGDAQEYQDLCRRARGEYETRLNWDAWARRTVAVLESCLGS
ncbi:MAG: glycosyltransferase [Candidatus Eisenbacteria bacterium]|nr:glycosyltransferase [Candidatus Eisenbacteria bacterium]